MRRVIIQDEDSLAQLHLRLLQMMNELLKILNGSAFKNLLNELRLTLNKRPVHCKALTLYILLEEMQLRVWVLPSRLLLAPHIEGSLVNIERILPCSKSYNQFASISPYFFKFVST